MNELCIRLQMEEIICEREGMIAENKWRELQGESLPYGENSFFNLTKRLSELRELLKK